MPTGLDFAACKPAMMACPAVRSQTGVANGPRVRRPAAPFPASAIHLRCRPHAARVVEVVLPWIRDDAERAVKVSVLVPAYNAEAFVAETVESVRAQTHQDWELLVVDDGSTDRTVAVLESLAAVDPRIRVLRQANAGTQAARNLALARATGEWIALLDHDDVWLPHKLERQLELARQQPPADLVFSNYAHWNGRADLQPAFEDPRRLPEGDVLERLSRHCLFGALTVIVRRSALVEAGGFDVRFLRCGDWDLWLRLAEHGARVRGTNEILARWRVWDGNLSRNRLSMRREEVLVLEAALERSRAPDRRRMYGLALRSRRGDLLVREALDDGRTGAALSRAILRAWMLRPSRARMLELALAQVWPDALGGAKLRRRAERTMERKF